MNVYYRFFRVSTGPLLDQAKAIDAQRETVLSEVEAFCKKVGADTAHFFSLGSLAGFVFETSVPDPGVWKTKNKNGLFMPRLNTKAGMQIEEQRVLLPRLPQLSDALKTIGLDGSFPVLMHGNRAYSVSITGSSSLGVFFIGVPWRDIDPAELEECRKQKAAGLHFGLEHLLWTPSSDMVEVKEWEVMREIEQLNEQLKARNAA